MNKRPTIEELLKKPEGTRTYYEMLRVRDYYLSQMVGKLKQERGMA